MSAAVQLGPVSTQVVAELREEARDKGTLIWLDKSEHYTTLADALADGTADFPFPVYRYRGSFLELLLTLENAADAVTPPPLVVHMPGFVEDDIKQTPLLALYKAGRRYRLKLDSAVRNAAHGKLTPAEIDQALSQGLASLDAADAWLDTSLNSDADGERTTLPVSSPQQLYDELGRAGPIAAQIHGPDNPGGLDAILIYLERTLGLDSAWRDAHTIPLTHAQDLQLLMSSWALCVEFVHDLKRPPRDDFLRPLSQLPKPLIAASRALAEHIRERFPDAYVRDADLIESGLVEELVHASADDLGKIDTLRFEDKKVFAAALDALRNERWQQAADYAAGRTEQHSFWVRQDLGRRFGWRAIALAAELGLACEQQQDLLHEVKSLAQAAECYAARGYHVDNAQRHFEQARGQEPLPLRQLDEYPQLVKCQNHVRAVYRRWADAQAVAFNTLCQQVGFLPEPEHQQRTLFDDVVRPAVEQSQGPVAYFMVDAMRFEMGQQLLSHLEKESGAKLSIKPRFAELPSVTEVGMNLLAPVARDGRLRIELRNGKIDGFRAGEVRVYSPETRQKAIHARVGGETCPKLALEDLLDTDSTRLKRTIARARVIIVHAEGIDKAGEKGVGLSHLEDELQRLRTVWAQLREAGVRRFVVTADHGFLLQDSTTREPLRHGRKIDPKRRHVIETIAADHEGEVRVAAAELGYDNDKDNDASTQFMFPQNSQPFDTGAASKVFLHGGNSLQERLIPVISAEYRHDKGGTAVQHRVDARAVAGFAGLHRLQGKVALADNQGFGFGGLRYVELRLAVVDDVDTDISVELIEADGARLSAGALVAEIDKEFELRFRLSGPREHRAQVELRAVLGSDDVRPALLERRFAVDVNVDAITLAETDDNTSESKPNSAATGHGKTSAAPAADRSAPGNPNVGNLRSDNPDIGSDWLQHLPDDQTRTVFAHIQQYGAINEADATQLLGSARRFRQFSRRFEDYAELAPFELHIDASSGQKRYCREGGGVGEQR